jgi:hypothetical protein
VSWITTNNLLARYNESATLVQGDLSPAAGAFGNNPGIGREIERRMRFARGKAIEVSRIITEKERSDKSALLASLERRLLQAELKPKQQKVLRDYLETKGELDDEEIRNAIRLVMSTPEFQLT